MSVSATLENCTCNCYFNPRIIQMQCSLQNAIEEDSTACYVSGEGSQEDKIKRQSLHGHVSGFSRFNTVFGQI